jgi:hypothetical protein
MAVELKRIRIKKRIEVGNILIEPIDNEMVTTWLILYDNCELRIYEDYGQLGISRLNEPIETNNTKTIWQKAQQQIDDNQNDKRYNKPFEDDGAYADD